MYKKTIKYVDYNGTERTEDFYFNLSKAELMEMETSVVGGFRNTAEKYVAEQDTPKLYKIFKEFVLNAYGEKSADGKRFMKTDDNGRPLSKAFSETEAYSVMMTEFSDNPKLLAEFMDQVIPNDVSNNDEVRKALNSIGSPAGQSSVN